MKTMPHVRFTREDYLRLPEGFPAQLVEGFLVKSPSATPGHQVLAGRVYDAVRAVVGPGRVVQAPLDVFLDDFNVYQPDVLVWAKPQPWTAVAAPIPILVVEILSPSTHRRDRRAKTPRYLAGGVREVWLVDPERRSIAVHSASGVLLAQGADPARSAVLAGFSLVPDVLFGS
jgi:Uma2 family endonuclease